MTGTLTWVNIWTQRGSECHHAVLDAVLMFDGVYCAPDKSWSRIVEIRAADEGPDGVWVWRGYRLTPAQA